jgi:transcriptional regulator with XRE-family HTH domain
MDFPGRLKELRTQHKLTQEELGKKVNVSKVSISGYENGNRTPDMETLQKLADVLDIKVDYLLGRDPESNVTTTIAGQDITLSPEELRILEEIRKHPVMFHELAKNPERSVKDLIKMWNFIKQDMAKDDDDFDEEILKD